MTTSQQTQSKKSPWRWILLGLAIGLFILWLSLTPEGLLGKADAVGYAVCHRISERSFKIGERQMPMCARCSGLFLGAMLGLIFQVVQGRKGKMPSLPVAIFFGALALAWVLDGLNSFAMLTPILPSVYKTQNWTRLATGTGMGLAVCAVLYPAYIQTMFTSWKNDSGLGKWHQLSLIVALAVILDILVLLEIPWLQYVFSLTSAAGVMVLLTMVYSMVLVMLFKKENTYDSLKGLFMPLVGGFIMVLLQIGGIDLVRYLWAGSWEGFNIAAVSTIIK